MRPRVSDIKNPILLIVAVLALFAVCLTNVSPAVAAPPPTVSAGPQEAILREPTAAQRIDAMRELTQARAKDPSGFAERLRMIEGSRALTDFLSADTRFDLSLQQQFLAAAMPTDALQALVELTDSRYIRLEIQTTESGAKVASIKKAPAVSAAGGLGAMSVVKAFPQCPSAWAALWAWWSTNAAFCGAMGFFGPGAALACSAAFAVGGSLIDFNQGC